MYIIEKLICDGCRDRAKYREDSGRYSRRGSWCWVLGHLLIVCKRFAEET
jgi:hypothetical protein